MKACLTILVLSLSFCDPFQQANAGILSGLFRGPKKALLERWQKHDEKSTLVIDHSLWDDLLKRHVKPNQSPNYAKDQAPVNLVDYKSLKHQPKDLTKLKQYLELMSLTPISSHTKSAQLAYWINLYNALTVDQILKTYPVSSIRQIGNGWFSAGPWDDEVIKVEGKNLTLNQIEHSILRPIWNDPRIHYVINCASLSCPDLKNKAFQSLTIEDDLNSAAVAFLTKDKAIIFKDNRIELSMIYSWFQNDFGPDQPSVINHIQKILTQLPLKSKKRTKLLQALKQSKLTISYQPYNWELNDLKKQK